MTDDLPSREETVEALVQYKGANVSVGPVTRTNVLTTFRKVAEARASGRLVDRETIEAWIAEHRYAPGDWVVDNAALDALAAAIGDTGKTR